MDNSNEVNVYYSVTGYNDQDVMPAEVLAHGRGHYLPAPPTSDMISVRVVNHTMESPVASNNLSHWINLSDFLTVPPEPIMPTFNEMSMIKTVVLSLMFVISLIGNTATLIQMFRMRRRKSTINLLILHLAVADLIVTFFCNVTDAVWASTVQWLGGNILCKMVKFLQVFGLYLSTYIIVIVSLDRCYAILDPMSRNKAPRRVRAHICAAWLLSALFSLPQTYIFRVKRGPFQAEFYQCVTYGAYTEPWQEQLYSCLSVLLMFVLPLVTMISAYMLIFCTIAAKSRSLQREAAESADAEMLSRGPVRGQLFRKAKVKSLRMTALIVAAFIVCWTPYYVVFIIFTFFDSEQINSNAFIWIFFFGMANSMVNPMIYGAFHMCKKRRRRLALRGLKLRGLPRLPRVPYTWIGSKRSTRTTSRNTTTRNTRLTNRSMFSLRKHEHLIAVDKIEVNTL